MPFPLFNEIYAYFAILFGFEGIWNFDYVIGIIVWNCFAPALLFSAGNYGIFADDYDELTEFCFPAAATPIG